MSRRLAIVALAAALALALTVPTAAAAAWRATTSAPVFSLSTSALAAPVTTCTSKPAVLGVSSYAQISWSPVTDATSYTVTATNSANGANQVVATGVTATTIDVTGSVLTSLLSSVVRALLDGGSVVITVTAVTRNWTSPPSNGQPIVLSSVVGGLLGGVKCQS
ncbi:hypothetical protein MTE01_24460 [Microbacterium testaceum]|uniref:Uncharacterized protein n=1 Tax=Microbacterium testaceum TaxID=2033 RepID=A0A4Y3QMZ9_MICTE|nr:hypothetical protein [Microbacterium testaceum]GEB46501.1 hypothetical protein MTE01_24460 [Microbacterium testaceum]